MRAADVTPIVSQPRNEVISDVPENVFGPPGVITRLTNLLHTIKTPEIARPEVVAKGQQLAADPHYPNASHLSALASELLGGKKD